MSLLDLIRSGWKVQTRLDQLIEELAAQCVDAVLKRLSEQVYRMSRNECRGYVRARAALVVNRAVARAEDLELATAASIPYLRAEVLETTTRLVQQSLATRPWRSTVRRAA